MDIKQYTIKWWMGFCKNQEGNIIIPRKKSEWVHDIFTKMGINEEGSL